LSKEIRRIDRKEEEHVKKLADAFDAGEGITLNEVFNSEMIPKMLDERPLSYIDSFHKGDPALTLNCLIFPRMIVTICPGCDCNANPELIKPYLESGIVLPVLLAPLQDFKAGFADLALQYPYIGLHTFDLLRFVQSYSTAGEDESAICPHCFDDACERILKKLSESNGDKKKISDAGGVLKNITFPSLRPTFDHELRILKEIEGAVSQENPELVHPLTTKATTLYALRNSQIFDAIPEIAQEDLSNIGETLRKSDLSLDQKIVEAIEERKWIIDALCIDYNPKMPFEEYLDIILPRRKKICSLVNSLVSDKENDQRVRAQVNDEIWKINEEISSSKAIELLTFLTNFVSDNSKILFGMLVGGLVGYSSASFVGCGLGIAGGLAGEMVRKFVSKQGVAFRVTKYPKRTMEWLKEKIESPEEKLLSIMLSKDIRVIQTWALRKKLRKT